MLLADVAATATAVADTRSRRRKVELIAACLTAMRRDEIAVGTSHLAGAVRQERLGVGPALVRSLAVPPAPSPGVELLEVDRALETVAGAAGPGSATVRRSTVESLLAAATAPEQRFLIRLILGDLRQGALAGVMVQAIARAWNVDEALVRRAVMLRGDLGAVAEAAAGGGAAALAAFGLELFRPVQPMLAQTSASVAAAMTDPGRRGVEYKLDGARIQVHRRGATVRIYTRNLRDVSERSTDVAIVVAGLPCDQVILDGEVLVLDGNGRPEPFQRTMARFGTESSSRSPDMDGGDPLSTGLPMTPFFFDILHLDGVDLLDEPLAVRVEALSRLVPGRHRVPRVVAEDAAAGEALLRQALADGHEGVMVKDLSAPYEAGRRGAAWHKVKPVHTLDLVVLAAEWGSGRRRGWLSNLHLGARDPHSGQFVMLGKTFKGMTDELLRWQTARLLEREEGRDRHVVFVRPELVVEVAIDGVQASSRYPGGLTLRFARVRRYRDDKSPAEADTVDAVRAIHDRGQGLTSPGPKTASPASPRLLHRDHDTSSDA